MIILLASALLLAQDPQDATPTPEPPAAPVPIPAPAAEPERASDPVESPPATVRKALPQKAEPPPRRNPGPGPRPSSCLSRRYADAHPDACGGPTAEETERVPAGSQKAVPAPVPVQPLKRAPAGESGQPSIAVPKTPGTRPSIPVLIALGTGILVLLAAAVAATLRFRKGHSAVGVREVELAGPGMVVLSPTHLARGTGGPGKSRWSIRDGRLIVKGPEGSLLNGVPLDRSGDVVSTGDTVRLGGAEYRVRII